MEQRHYGGNLNAQELGDFLVHFFDPKSDLQAQRIGQEQTHLVQIGRGDVPADLRYAVTVAIAPAADGAGLTVSLGQQNWLTPKTAAFTATIGLVSLLVTPFALFALLWPLSDAVGSTSLAGDVWDAIESYVASASGSLTGTQQLQHPHALRDIA